MSKPEKFPLKAVCIFQEPRVRKVMGGDSGAWWRRKIQDEQYFGCSLTRTEAAMSDGTGSVDSIRECNQDLCPIFQTWQKLKDRR